MIGKVIIPAELELKFDDQQTVIIRALDSILYVNTKDITNIYNLLSKINSKVSSKYKVEISKEETLGLQ
jgi:hypothetical protein